MYGCILMMFADAFGLLIMQEDVVAAVGGERMVHGREEAKMANAQCVQMCACCQHNPSPFGSLKVGGAGWRKT